jgi:hypothetical protein
MEQKDRTVRADRATYRRRASGSSRKWTTADVDDAHDSLCHGSSHQSPEDRRVGLPLTAAALYFTKGDVNQAIIEAIGLGRDNDTTGGLAGNIAGAMQGASAIRPDWISTVESANADFFEEPEGDRNANFLRMSERLVEALRNEARAARDRGALLDRLLT